MVAALPTLGLPGRPLAAAELGPQEAAVCKRIGVDPKRVAQLVEKPLYQFTEPEVDAYLRYLATVEPDLRKRIVHLARKNIGQPYELYLLGEMPFEPYDPQPIYCLGKSDCLVFAEHTYAMALSHNWPSFMRMLQRIRYRDGRLGVVTRNHYTEADWNLSNDWLVEDLTAQLAGDSAVSFVEKIDRAKFFKTRYGLAVEVPVEVHKDLYLPYGEIARAKSELRDGDFVNVVRAIVRKDAPPNETFGGSAFVGHVGLIAHGASGEVHIIHSAEPRVREETLEQFIAKATKENGAKDAAGKPRLVGFKFLQLRENPVAALKKKDGPEAPRVTLPSGAEGKL